MKTNPINFLKTCSWCFCECFSAHFAIKMFDFKQFLIDKNNVLPDIFPFEYPISLINTLRYGSKIVTNHLIFKWYSLTAINYQSLVACVKIISSKHCDSCILQMFIACVYVIVFPCRFKRIKTDASRDVLNRSPTAQILNTGVFLYD